LAYKAEALPKHTFGNSNHEYLLEFQNLTLRRVFADLVMHNEIKIFLQILSRCCTQASFALYFTQKDKQTYKHLYTFQKKVSGNLGVGACQFKIGKVVKQRKREAAIQGRRTSPCGLINS